MQFWNRVLIRLINKLSRRKETVVRKELSGSYGKSRKNEIKQELLNSTEHSAGYVVNLIAKKEN